MISTPVKRRTTHKAMVKLWSKREPDEPVSMRITAVSVGKCFNRSAIRTRKQRSPRNIALTQKFKPGAKQHIRSTLVIIHMQGERGKASGPRQQRIGKMHIYFCHKQRGQQLRQLRGYFPQFYHDHLADAEGHIVFL